MGMEGFPSMENKKNIPDNISQDKKERFESGEWKMMNTEPIQFTQEELDLVSNGKVDSPEVQKLLAEKGIEFGDGHFYRVNDGTIMEFGSDMGTLLITNRDEIISSS